MDQRTENEIETITQKILKDAGIVEPPVPIEDLLDFLSLDRDFYDLEDPSLLRKFWHKVKVQGHQLIRVINKIKLAAVLLPDEARILVDSTLPSPKQEWASFHDVAHRIFEWHRPFFLGDTAQTLDPDYQGQLEDEANYGASSLMFCGQVFTAETRDMPKEWASVAYLKHRYKRSWVTTLRRYVQYGQDHPMAMLISTPFWLQKPDDQKERCRHYVISHEFRLQFSSVTPKSLLKEVDKNSRRRIGGPVGDFTCGLRDDNGTVHHFRGESFFNRHYILTLFVQTRESLSTRIIVPSTRTVKSA